MKSKKVQELQKQLKAAQEEERKERESKRLAYEKRRDELINELATTANLLNEQMELLKAKAFQELAAFRIEMLDYGTLRGKENNKGNFEIKNDSFKICFSSQVNKGFDERAELAEEKLKTFLTTFVKKRDQATFQLVMALLERNAAGDFDIGLISRLYTMEDQFDDDNWKDAIRLFKESYSPTNTAQYVRFFAAQPNGGWRPIVLDFAKLSANKA